jgi:hypothetical protein
MEEKQRVFSFFPLPAKNKQTNKGITEGPNEQFKTLYQPTNMATAL